MTYFRLRLLATSPDVPVSAPDFVSSKLDAAGFAKNFSAQTQFFVWRFGWCSKPAASAARKRTPSLRYFARSDQDGEGRVIFALRVLNKIFSFLSGSDPRLRFVRSSCRTRRPRSASSPGPLPQLWRRPLGRIREEGVDAPSPEAILKRQPDQPQPGSVSC